MRDKTRPAEPIEAENAVAAKMIQARGCCRRGASSLVKVMQMLKVTMRCVKFESI